MELAVPGSFFRLTLLGYQYPDAEGEPYDANWLLVRVDAAGPQGAWSVADPCLLTREVAGLAGWLEGLQAGQADPAISFLEPALLFRLVEREGGERFLRVHFGSLVHPAWSSEPGQPLQNPDLWLDFPLAELDLAAAAGALRDQLKKYPPRYER
jgi:hypothetical protein